MFRKITCTLNYENRKGTTSWLKQDKDNSFQAFFKKVQSSRPGSLADKQKVPQDKATTKRHQNYFYWHSCQQWEKNTQQKNMYIMKVVFRMHFTQVHESCRGQNRRRQVQDKEEGKKKKTKMKKCRRVYCSIVNTDQREWSWLPSGAQRQIQEKKKMCHLCQALM